jgi:hypothetical protein
MGGKEFLFWRESPAIDNGDTKTLSSVDIADSKGMVGLEL